MLVKKKNIWLTFLGKRYKREFIRNKMSSKRGKSFYADAAKGYTIKVIIDVLSGALSRATINLGVDGISIRKMDTNEHILFDINLPREKFRKYKCKKSMRISLNLKHLQKMVRNVKKKDSMIIFIDRKKPTKLGLSIRPEGAQKSKRAETVYVAIQIENDPEKSDELPDTYTTKSGEEKSVYGHPMVIGATDFQKIKKMATVGKEIVVKIQKDSYLSFYSNADIFSSELEFGEILSEDETESEDESEDEYHVSDNEELIGDDEEYESEEETTSDVEVPTPKDDEPSWYEATFYTSMFSLLVKLPGLCSQMQFYAPRFGYPLKIKMDAGTGNSILGVIQVYIKDINMINIINTEQSFS